MDIGLLRDLLGYLLVPGGLFGAWLTLRKGKQDSAAAREDKGLQRQDESYTRSQALMQVAIDSLTGQLIRVEGEVVTQRGEMALQRSEIMNLRAELNQAHEQIRRLTEEAEISRRDKDDLHEQLAIEQAKVQDLTARLAAANIAVTPITDPPNA